MGNWNPQPYFSGAPEFTSMSFQNATMNVERKPFLSGVLPLPGTTPCNTVPSKTTKRFAFGNTRNPSNKIGFEQTWNEKEPTFSRQSFLGESLISDQSRASCELCGSCKKGKMKNANESTDRVSQHAYSAHNGVDNTPLSLVLRVKVHLVARIVRSGWQYECQSKFQR